MRTIRALTTVTCLLLAAMLAVPAAASRRTSAVTTSRPGVVSHPVKTGLNGPAGFTFGPGGKIWYLERGTGEVRILNPTNGHDHLFFTISHVDGTGERGALGIALHPNWPKTPYVYVYVTRADHGVLVNELIRVRSAQGKGRGFRVLFKWSVSGATNHNGGRILFGPDGKLYAVAGENANPVNSQDLTANLRGKVLRINPDGTIPKDNTYGRIWSYGLRNSFGFTFDPLTGRLWETENGPECNDEINLIVKGANFGWGPNENCAGTPPGDTNNSGPTPRHMPKWFTSPGTIGITGAAFCDACGLPSLNGDLLFGNVNDQSIQALRMNGARTGFSGSTMGVLSGLDGVYSMEVSPAGRIYYSGQNGIYRLGPT
jgi:aldose sugar dehydrogenase